MLRLSTMEGLNISDNSSFLLLCMFPKSDNDNVSDKQLELESQ